MGAESSAANAVSADFVQVSAVRDTSRTVVIRPCRRAGMGCGYGWIARYRNKMFTASDQYGSDRNATPKHRGSGLRI